MDEFSQRLDGILSRAGLRSQVARDWALAIAVAVLSAGGVVLLILFAGDADLLAMPTWHVAWVAVLLTLQGLALGIRRGAPVAALWLVLVLQLAVLAFVPGGTSIWGPAVLVAAYSLGSHVPTERAWRVMRRALAVMLVLGFAVGAMVAPLLVGASPRPSELGLLALNHLGSTGFALLAPFLVGVYIATRREHLALVRQRADDEILAQRIRADAAIAAERTRMARELHDIAAHHLSGMVVQAAAVERLVDRDPDAAKAGANWIREQGRETLSNLRSVVGMLRGDAGGLGVAGLLELEDGGAPVPGLAVAQELIETARSLGDDISVEQHGEPWALAPIADVAAYRVLQEALSNSRQHAAGGPVRVRMLHEPERFELTVENGAAEHPAVPETDRQGVGSRRTSAEDPIPTARQGLGLLGMRERAHLCGGTLDAGPTGGGWRVRLELPRPSEETR